MHGRARRGTLSRQPISKFTLAVAHISFLDDESPVFPPTDLALKGEHSGLLAVGGNLEPKTLVKAYSRGIFPWYSPGEPILWWSPSPRTCLSPNEAHFSRSLRKLARKRPFSITTDKAFSDVIELCSEVERPGQEGTWISPEMKLAYSNLHELGIAHSIEAWSDGQLVGGLYGVALGRAFFGESMFSLQTGASKLAFASLCTQLQLWEYSLIDCQVHTPLLASFGAIEVEREEFENRLASALDSMQTFNWVEQWSLGEAGFDGS